MGQTQTQQQQQQNEPALNEHLILLQKSASTTVHYIQGIQDKIQFQVQCPKCHHFQFDDQLGRLTNCYFCKLVFSVNDGHVQVKNNFNLTDIEDKRCKEILNKQQINLESATFYVNRSILDNALIKDNKIDYQTLVNNVLLPFFSVRSRFLEQGIKFSIGPFEFCLVGGYPNSGIINNKTQIYCFGSYSTELTTRVLVLSTIPSNQLNNDIKKYFQENPKQNQIIQDSTIKINTINIQILSCDNASGQIGRHSQIESMSNVSQIRELKLLCTKCPNFQQFSQFVGNAKEAILKSIIYPYFQGFRRFLENSKQIIIGDFEFQVSMQENCGIVVLNHTQIDIDLSYQRNEQIRIRQYRQQLLESPFPSRFQFTLRRNDQSIHREQQIEALHRLLNTFILLNENQQILLQLRNKSIVEEQINRLPPRKIDMDFVQQNKNDEYHIKCMICLEEYVKDQDVRTMPCLHYFHQDCIDSWLLQYGGSACPICKTDIGQALQMQQE